MLPNRDREQTVTVTVTVTVHSFDWPNITSPHVMAVTGQIARKLSTLSL